MVLIILGMFFIGFFVFLIGVTWFMLFRQWLRRRRERKALAAETARHEMQRKVNLV